ncbi:hypothetical protein SSP24_06000 [Streptomyces spinoverrucosus]|uniref:Uncharacterized protein n=1 Tax=Streptomyces spinoverrucosus TaxID=284043 RepID=A0A4Y3V974_9ACTN|nr:hypothetical protein [Streptomyces spinoverrucosus]GEC02945.1 hypothetical protein SSP24_06000 [Streptomyces spinoverrucosus]GHB39391.1 hypothetical protein GCM10010397_06590 [Streptomyces spinoverrucosus]
MQNLFISFLRTVVPYGVALVLTATGWLGIPVDSEAAASAVALGLGAAYYAVFRGLEALAERMAWRPLQLAAGLLLGWARPPQYEKPAVLPLRFQLDMDAMQKDLAAMRRVLGVDEDRR